MVRFSVASMNILADPYIASGDYSICVPRYLWPGWRWPANNIKEQFAGPEE